ncbi:MAG TPA: DUF6492 family protein, partial [bacterium]|nr:DUF6492 family protein [bacterium]
MSRPLQVVVACRLRDLPILELAVQRMERCFPPHRLCVLAPDQDCAGISGRLGGEVRVLAEDGFIPGMKSADLRALQVPGFPKMAGWYFQQFLKLQFAFFEPEDEHYLIWDADTIPLRPMEFFNATGKMLLTTAEEFHAPYFSTYERILGAEAKRDFSFIAQHMLVQKSVARELLVAVEAHVPGDDGWAWKIMRSLPQGQGVNLFSEYETYGHYVKSRYPDRVECVRRHWTRGLLSPFGQALPSEKVLAELGKTYDYAAFERAYGGVSGWF